MWVSDIPPQAGGAPTYLRTHQGWVCPGGIKDACSRTVISTAMDTTMTTDLVEWALRRARALRGGLPKNVILHSDRGAQFTSEQMYGCCQELKLDQSMGRTGVVGAPPAWSVSARGNGTMQVTRIAVVNPQIRVLRPLRVEHNGGGDPWGRGVDLRLPQCEAVELLDRVPDTRRVRSTTRCCSPPSRSPSSNRPKKPGNLIRQ